MVTIHSSCITFFLPSYGVCEAYAGEATICNSVIQTSVDHVFIPHIRFSQSYISFALNNAAGVLGGLPEHCRDIAISLFCTFYLIPCGNSTVFYPPSSVCSEQCLHLRNLCPVEWRQAELFIDADAGLVANGLSFIKCNNTGLILEPLPHCCTDAGITLRKCYCRYRYNDGIMWVVFVFHCLYVYGMCHWWD